MSRVAEKPEIAQGIRESLSSELVEYLDSPLTETLWEVLASERWDGDYRIQRIIELNGFPALRVELGALTRPELPAWQDLYDDSDQRRYIGAAIAATGQLRYGHYDKPIGTAWLARADIAVTARHVALLFASENQGRASFLQQLNGAPLSAHLDMLDETPGDISKKIQVVEPLWIEPEPDPATPDFALLRVEASHGIASLEMGETAYPEQRIVVVGYPGSTNRYLPRNPVAHEQYFGSTPHVKRVSPGWVIDQHRWRYPWEFWTNATTYFGSSGSPVVDTQTGRVAGVHFDGAYLEGNYAVRADIIADRIRKLVEESVLPAHPG